MATTRRNQKSKVWVSGVELLRLCHAAKRSTVTRRRNAAASLFSLLVLHLKDETINIPADMQHHYEELTR